jgi:hypothetical protein
MSEGIMPNTAGFSTQEEIDAAMERLRASKGRMVELLPTYTFKNGAIATVHRIGQMTIAQIASGVERKIPPVPVPTFMADLGAGPVEQSNPASKEYQAAVADRRARVNMLTMDKLIDLAIDIEIDQAELARLKAGMERIDEPLNELSDKVAFVKHCCVTDGAELSTLSALIRGDVEEAAEAAAATFSGDVPGETAEPLESAIVGGTLHASF